MHGFKYVMCLDSDLSYFSGNNEGSVCLDPMLFATLFPLGRKCYTPGWVQAASWRTEREWLHDLFREQISFYQFITFSFKWFQFWCFLLVYNEGSPYYFLLLHSNPSDLLFLLNSSLSNFPVLSMCLSCGLGCYVCMFTMAFSHAEGDILKNSSRSPSCHLLFRNVPRVSGWLLQVVTLIFQLLKMSFGWCWKKMLLMFCFLVISCVKHGTEV